MATDYAALGRNFALAEHETRRPNWGNALSNTANFANSLMKDISSIQETYKKQEDAKIGEYANLMLTGASGGEGEATDGLITQTYRANEGNPENMIQAMDDMWNANMTAENLSRSGASVEACQRWLDEYGAEMKAQFDLRAEQLQYGALRDSSLAAEDSRQRYVLTKADTWEEAERQIAEVYDSSGVGAFDGGSLSLSNEEHRAALVSEFGNVRGRKYIEQMSRSTDMTFGEMTDEVLKEYDRIIGEAGFTSPEAQLKAAENREALKESMRTYAEQVAGGLIQEADAKATRFQNSFSEMQAAGYEMDDASVQKLLDEGFDMDNLYDRAAARDIVIAQFGYDRDLSGEYEAANSVMSSPDLLSDLSSYAGSDVQRVSISLSDGSTLDINTRYGGYLQQKVTELGLSREEAEYLSRSLNQYAQTVSNWNSDQWKKHITALMVNPSVTEADYQQAVQSYKNAGLIDDATFDEYYSKKSSPYQSFIDDEWDYFEDRITVASEDGDAVWAELEHRGTLYGEVTNIVTRGKNSGKSDTDIRRDIENLISNTIAILRQDEQTDVAFKSSMAIIEDYTDYDPNYGFTTQGQTLNEINQAYLRGDYAGVFDESAVGAAFAYLQGSSSTRGDEGFWDTVAKSIYGNNATYDSLTPTGKEIVKANGSVAMAQWSNYQRGAKVFASGNMKFRSVNVSGYGIAAMGDDGIIYMPVGGDEYQLAYVKDQQERKRLLNPSNTDKVVSIDDPSKVSTGFYRRSAALMPDTQDEITGNDPYVDQYYGLDTSMRDQDDPTLDDKGNPTGKPREIDMAPYTQRMKVTDDPIFAGLKWNLINGGVQNAQL